MKKWKVFYGDDTTFDNTEGEAQDAPPINVMCIVYYDPEIGRAILHRWDWYYMKNGTWWGSDIHGLLDQLMWEKGISAVKQGRTASEKVYSETIDKAINDPDFPPKIGTKVHERASQII